MRVVISLLAFLAVVGCSAAPSPVALRSAMTALPDPDGIPDDGAPCLSSLPAELSHAFRDRVMRQHVTGSTTVVFNGSACLVSNSTRPLRSVGLSVRLQKQSGEPVCAGDACQNGNSLSFIRPRPSVGLPPHIVPLGWQVTVPLEAIAGLQSGEYRWAFSSGTEECDEGRPCPELLESDPDPVLESPIVSLIIANQPQPVVSFSADVCSMLNGRLRGTSTAAALFDPQGRLVGLDGQTPGIAYFRPPFYRDSGYTPGAGAQRFAFGTQFALPAGTTSLAGYQVIWRMGLSFWRAEAPVASETPPSTHWLLMTAAEGGVAGRRMTGACSSRPGQPARSARQGRNGVSSPARL